MRLAPATVFIVRFGNVDHAGAYCGRSNASILLRSNYVRLLSMRRPCDDLASRWHVFRAKTKRRCRWQARRSPRWQPHRACHKPVNKPMIIAI